MEPRVSRRKKVTKIKADINKRETEQTAEKKSMKPRAEIEQTILKAVWNHERLSIANAVLLLHDAGRHHTP